MTNDKIELKGDAVTVENIEAALKEKELNVYQKIVEVRKVAGGFYKDKKSFGFDYVSGNQILSKIRDKMNELNLILQPSVELGEHSNYLYKNARGQEKVDFVVWGKMRYTWINGDKPEERETVEWAYYGQQDDISKAFGSGLTYSERYFLLKALGLPTDEDEPDAKEPPQPTTPPKKAAPKPPQQKPQQTAAEKQQIKANQDTTPTPPPTEQQLSDAQIKRLYTLGTLATFTAEQVKSQIKTRFDKTVHELTKMEYDLICKGYQAKYDKSKEHQEQPQN